MSDWFALKVVSSRSCEDISAQEKQMRLEDEYQQKERLRLLEGF